MRPGEYPNIWRVEAAKAELRAGRDPEMSLAPAGHGAGAMVSANADVEPGSPSSAAMAEASSGPIAREGRAEQTK